MMVCNRNIPIHPNKSLNCQVAVVGSGPGGSVTAATLSKAGLNVLLIEEGPYLPLDSCAPFSQAEMVQKYRNRGLTVAFGSPKIQYVEGRCVGGGSEINSGLYYRIPTDVLAQWREKFQVKGLTETDLVPHYQACENAVSINYLPGKASGASIKLQEGATQLGWQSHEVPRWFKYESSTNSPAIAKGIKQSMTNTYIPEMLEAGGKLLAQTKIKLIRRQGDKWILKGCYTGDSAPYNIEITAKTVFVAAGAIHTPALLRRSGITHNVGNNLQMHPTVKVIAQFSEIVNSRHLHIPVHQVKEFAPQLSFGGSISSLAYLQLAMIDYPEYAHEVNQQWQYEAIYYVSLTGKGSGKVRCLPGFNDPLVRYKLHSDDLKVLAGGIKNLCRLLLTAKAKALFPLIPNATQLTELKQIDKLPQQLSSDTNLMTIHLFSSCPMGENHYLCATDSFGKVHGLENLYVADASLLCTATGVNPQGSVMAIARRNALQFLENQK